MGRRVNGAEQMTLDGSVGGPIMARNSHLNPAQREMLRIAHANGFVRPIEAGRIVHAGRTDTGCNKRHDRYKGEGCCGYCASDGVDALKRLVRRGLLVRGPGKGEYSIPVVTS